MSVFIIMISVFAIGISAIALEDIIKVNKAASALFTALILWVIYLGFAPVIFGSGLDEAFNNFLLQNPSLASESLHRQCVHFIVDNQIIQHLGDISGTLFFVMGTMVIIELIDIHGGFFLISSYINTHNKRRLLWIVSLLAFVISAMIDNLATAIIMIAMLRRLIPHNRERWIFSCMVIIAANAGGAWSPIGDVTTILMWTSGNITPLHQITHVLLPSFVCMFVSAMIVSRFFKKKIVGIGWL